MVAGKILPQGVGTFAHHQNPSPETFLTLEMRPFISNIAFMGIQADLYILGTHPKRRAPKNYANPRYKCVLISDMDPIGDKKVIEAPASIPNSGATNPLYNTAIPAPWCGGTIFNISYPPRLVQE